jgi:RNA polymerase sigma-70 factor (ECF subfamily)
MPSQKPVPSDADHRLSRILTMWTLLRQAHGGEGDAAAWARQGLMKRYSSAIYRYLLAAVRDPHAAEDLTQEFALRFLRGRFQRVDPGRGRFRDYVKTVLFHMVDDHRRRTGRERGQVSLEDVEPAAAPAEAHGDDRAFLESWRQDLLGRAWRRLGEVAGATGQPYYAVLRYRVANPDVSSPRMAEELSAKLGKLLTAANARQLLHRAREKFAELLVDETLQSLGGDADRLEEELTELNLLKYCRDAIDQGNW